MQPPMDADERRLLLDAITGRIIRCAHRVSNTLGIGFVEKVYENALVAELEVDGLEVKQQYPVQVLYRDRVVGDFVADLLVEGRVLVELKVVKALDDVHVAQCLNYLKATGLTVCLLMNFAEARVKTRRVVRDF